MNDAADVNAPALAGRPTGTAKTMFSALSGGLSWSLTEGGRVVPTTSPGLNETALAGAEALDRITRAVTGMSIADPASSEAVHGVIVRQLAAVPPDRRDALLVMLVVERCAGVYADPVIRVDTDRYLTARVRS